ncbi:MAG: hypothetical protein WCD70_09920 [Alphaproteobacteria bacterium]
MIKNDFDRNLPFQPPMRGADYYKALHRAIATAQPKSLPEPEYEEIHRSTTIVKQLKGVPMDEQKTLVDIIYKPNEKGYKLRPQEIQLLLAYYAEILKEAAAEEELIIEEEKAKQEQEAISCK